jgi:hypothetical protein
VLYILKNVFVGVGHSEYLAKLLKLFNFREICLWDTPRSWFDLKNIVRHVFVYGTP